MLQDIIKHRFLINFYIMKIWIDFINTPQVSFFEPFIKDLRSEGHEFILTCRDSSNTVDLLKQKGWAHTIIGDRVEKSLAKKLFAFPIRVNNLIKYLKKNKPDVAIGQSSFYLPIASKAVGFPSIYTNDNEHALGNIPSFLFASTIFLPENLSVQKAVKQGASRKKIIQYPGIKEGVYLWEKGIEIQTGRNKSIQNTIYIRPEPQTAQYYSGKENFLDDFIIDLKDLYKITILTRDKNQREHYLKDKFEGIEVPEKPLEFKSIATDCLVFIGAGGSMTREMAMMGIPTISVYQGELLDVDKYLIEQNLMLHKPDLNLEKFNDFLSNLNNMENGTGSLLQKGKTAFELFKKTILSSAN
jgi:predicted glycosyltransferase